MKKEHIVITEQEVVLTSSQKRIDLKKFEDKYPGNRYGYKLEWVQDWAAKAGIREKLNYNGQSLWHLMKYIFEWGSVEIKDAPYFGYILYWIDLTENIIKRLQPSQVDINIKDRLSGEIIRRTIEKYGINVNCADFKIKKKSFRLHYSLLKWRVWLRSLLKKKINKTSTKNKILCLSTDLFCSEKNEEDYLWGGIIKELNKHKISNEVLVYDRLWYGLSWKSIIKKIKLKDKSKSFVGQYYDGQVYSEIDEICNFIKQKGKEILADNNFRNSLIYKGVRFDDIIENRFNFVFNAFSYAVGDCLAITRRILATKKPELILIDHADNLYGQGFIINSRKSNCKIVALQYELVYPGCIATCTDEFNKDKTQSLLRPLPQINLVGGNYVKSILRTKCKYPNNTRIIVAGQPRYDAYFDLSKRLNKTKVRDLKTKLGLPSDKKIIVYATSSASADRKALTPLLDVIKGNKDLFLFLKIKPNANEKKFEKTFDLKQENITVKKYVDLKDLLPVTDLLITICSTVAMEAMIFDVPVLLIEKEINCPVPYEEHDSVLVARKDCEIYPKIKQIFEDPEIREKLRKGRKKFLKEYLFSEDGNSSKRIVKIIKDILGKTRVA